MKFLNALRLPFMTTPADPSASEGLVYFKSDGNLYKKVGSTEAAIGGGVDPTATYKMPVRAASTSNIAVSSPGTVIGGVTMVAGDRVLLTGQTAQAQNGIYVWNGSAVAMTRSADAASLALIDGLFVVVKEGFDRSSEYRLKTDITGTLGTTAVLAFFERDGSWYGNPYGTAPLDGDAKVPLANLPTGRGTLMDTWEGICSTGFTLTTTTFIDVPGATVTIPVGSTTDKFLVLMTANVYGNSGAANALATTQLVVDGVAQAAQMNSDGSLSTIQHTDSQQFIISGLTPGNRVIKMQMKNYNGVGNVGVQGTNTKLTVIRLTTPASNVPVGGILQYGGIVAPSGYFMCDGSAVSRAANPELFAAIGTTFGAGDGSTTFNLPNINYGTVGVVTDRVVKEWKVTGLGPYATATPGPTTGQVYNVPAAGRLKGVVHATAYTTVAGSSVVVDVYLDGVKIGDCRVNPAHALTNAHGVLSDFAFDVPITAGNHYLALRVSNGVGDGNDTWSYELVATVPDVTTRYIIRAAAPGSAPGETPNADSSVTNGTNVDASATKAYRRGGTVVLAIAATASAAISASATIFTLPVGFRPTALQFADVTNVNGETNVRLHIDTDGTVKAQQAIASGNALRGTVTIALPL